MALGTQHTAQEVFWYLVADDAKVAIRIHPGLRIGEDSSGDFTFQSDKAQIAFDLVNSDVVIQAVSEACELFVPETGRTRSITIGVNDRAQVELGHNTLEILLGFDRAGYSSGMMFQLEEPSQDFLKIEVVQAKTPLAAGDGMSIASLLKPKRAGPRSSESKPRRATAQQDATDKNHSRPKPEIAQADSPRVRAEVPPIEVSEPVQQRRTRLRDAIPYALLAILVTVSVTIVLIEPEKTTVAAPKVADENRVTNLVAPFRGETLPDSEVMALSLQSLITMHRAQPSDQRVHDGLVFATHRITDAAMDRFELGDAFNAGRLIELAASTGVARARVNDAILAFSQPQEPRASTPVSNPQEDTNREPEDIIVESEPEVIEPPQQPDPPSSPATTASRRTPIDADLLFSTMDKPAYGFQQYRTDTATPALTSPLTDPLRVFVPSWSPVLDNRGAVASEVAVDVPSATKPANDGFALQGDSLINTRLIDASLQTPVEGRFNLGPSVAIDLSRLQKPPPLQPSPAFYPLSQLTFVERPAPVYPRSAPDGASASVVVEITVTERGDVEQIDINSNTPSYFRKAAERALRKWKFEPVLENQQPVSVRTAIKLNFQG